MNWTVVGLAALVSAGAGFLAGNLAASHSGKPPPDTYVDLSAATPEFREKMKDEEFVKFISSVKFMNTEPGASDKPPEEPLDLPDDLPTFPIANLYKPGPDISWLALEDDALQATLDEAANGWVIVNLWASWCAPCIAELPDMDRASDRYAELGISLLTINADPAERDDRATVDRIFAERGVETLEPLIARRSDITTIAEAFGMTRLNFSLPNNVVYAPDGRPVAVFKGGAMTGQSAWDSDAAAAVLQAIIENDRSSR